MKRVIYPVELLRDGKGIYGLIGEVPAARSHAVQTVTFVLRPDIIREGGIDDGLACAALQTLPRRMSVFKHTVEDNLRRGFGEAMVGRTGMFFEGQKTARIGVG